MRCPRARGATIHAALETALAAHGHGCPPQHITRKVIGLSLDEAMAVEDHDVVMVPRGYHPVVAPHGYELYYLNVMAGPQRRWVFRNDPAHEWMLAR